MSKASPVIPPILGCMLLSRTSGPQLELRLPIVTRREPPIGSGGDVSGSRGSWWVDGPGCGGGIGNADRGVESVGIPEEQAENRSEVRDKFVAGPAGEQPTADLLECRQRGRLQP